MKKIIIPVVVIIFGAAGAFAYKSLKIEKIPALLDRQIADSEMKEWKHIKMNVEELHSNIRKNPQDNSSRLRLAGIYVNEGHISGKHFYYYSAAMDLLNYIIETSTDVDAVRTDARLNKASLLLSLNQFEQAIEICTELSEEGHQSQQLSEIKVDGFIGIGDYANAQKIVDQMMASGIDIKVCLRVAALHEIRGNINEAKDVLKRGLESGSTNKDLYWKVQYRLGGLYEKEGDFVTAEKLFKGILTGNPENGFAKAGVARIKAVNKDYEEAVAMLEEAYKTNPVMLIKQDIAQTYINSGRKNDARKEVQDIVNTLEDGEKVGCNYDLVRARLYSEILEDFDLALIYAERAKNRWPENVELNKVLSLIYYKLGKYEDADFYLSKATSVQANDPSLMCLSGLLKYKTGDSKVGVDIIKKAIEHMHFHYSVLVTEAEFIISKHDLSFSMK